MLQQLEQVVLRTGYHNLAVPVHVSGIGGQAAPHHFEFYRRSQLGALQLSPAESESLILPNVNEPTIFGNLRVKPPKVNPPNFHLFRGG